jgi:regulator of nonsense transcripts 2
MSVTSHIYLQRLLFTCLILQRLQEQDRRNHEAYIRSGEIFEDRQQAYEKMTKGYEKLLTGCQTYVSSTELSYDTHVSIASSISDLLYLPMPSLPTAAQKNESVLLLSAASGGQLDSEDTSFPTGGKWEDEEERRFHEDLQDLRDFVPKSVLGLDNNDKRGEQSKEDLATVDQAAKEKERKEVEQAEIQMLEKEIEGLGLNGVDKMPNGTIESPDVEDEEYVIS